LLLLRSKLERRPWSRTAQRKLWMDEPKIDGSITWKDGAKEGFAPGKVWSNRNK